MKIIEVDSLIEHLQLRVFGDGGYHHYRIISSEAVPAVLKQVQKDERSGVKIVIGLVKSFQVACGVFYHSSKLQEYVLAIVYNLTQLKMDDNIIFL